MTFAPIDDWLDMMGDVVSVATFAGRDAYGVASYGAPTDYPARVLYKQQLIRTGSGEQIAARGNAIIATTNPIGTEDRIGLDDGTFPLVLSVSVVPDETGPLYTKLYFS